MAKQRESALDIDILLLLDSLYFKLIVEGWSLSQHKVMSPSGVEPQLPLLAQ